MITSTGTPVGGIKHVWLIILENKSYDETFTGLNQNSYLWQTLPQQGALLTHYYGTGHFSMDNYISLVSGQAPSYAVQDDCSTTANMTNNNCGIITTGTVGTATDTDGTADASGHVHHDAEPRPARRTATTASSLVHGGVDAALGEQRLRVPDQRADAVQSVQRRGRLVEGLRPGPRRRAARRLDDLRDRQPRPGSATPFRAATTVTCGYPGTSDQQPGHEPDQPGRADRRRLELHRRAAAPNAEQQRRPADQYVAKHFPFGGSPR